MRLRWLGVLALVLLWSSTVLADSGPDYRSLFFYEVLTPGATEWTHRFDDYQPTSYRVDKVDLASSLSSYARQRRQRLLGVLVIGPVGFLWTYQVITFVREGPNVRVVSTVFPHARVTAKATRTLEPGDFDALLESIAAAPGLAQAPDLEALARALERRSIEQGANLAAEWQANVVFVDYRDGSVIFGELDANNADAMQRAVEPLLAGLAPTYGHGDRPVGAPRRGGRSVSYVPFVEVRENAVPSLDRELARFGYGGFDRNAVGFGLGFEVLWGRFKVGQGMGGKPDRMGLRFSLDGSYGWQSAEHTSARASATLTRWRATPRVGLDVLSFGGASLTAFSGLRWGLTSLSSEGALRLPLTKDEQAEREVLELELGLALEYYLPRTFTWGGVIGTRSGIARPVYESSLDGAPFSASTDARGAFTQLYLGVCLCSPAR